MKGYVTVCYSDQTKETFSRGVMRIDGNGTRTNVQIRRDLTSDEVKDRDFYIKPDPNFDDWSYSVCHKTLRTSVVPGDIIFFRTLWGNCQYFIGYFLVYKKIGDKNDPICLADPSRSLLIDGYKYKITPSLVKTLNPNADFTRNVDRGRLISSYLSRYYLGLDEKRTLFLRSEMDKFS